MSSITTLSVISGIIGVGMMIISHLLHYYTTDTPLPFLFMNTFKKSTVHGLKQIAEAFLVNFLIAYELNRLSFNTFIIFHTITNVIILNSIYYCSPPELGSTQHENIE